MSAGTKLPSPWLESFTFDDESGTFRAAFDSQTTAASAAVIDALSEVLGTGPTAIEPLYETVETDALDAIVHHRSATDTVQVSFVLEGRHVAVSSDGMIKIEAQSADLEDDPSDRGPAE